MNNPFELEKMWKLIEHNCTVMKSDLEMEDQTPIVRLQQAPQQGGAQLPSLPLMGDLEICRNVPRHNVTTHKKQFRRASKLLLHPNDMPDIKLVEDKEMINRENRLEDRRNDNITLCELTEEPDSHEKVKKSINTVIPAKMVQDANKEEGIDDKSREETIN